MQLEFTKMHGAGNDVIVFDAPRDGSLPSAEQWRALSDRHKGIGFDQAMVIEPPRRAGTQAYYRIFNADGGEVEQCGNGVRCVAAFLLRRGDVKNGEIQLDSPAGLIRARIHTPELVSVDMGAPNFDPKSLPFDASAEARGETAQTCGQDLAGWRSDLIKASDTILQRPKVRQRHLGTTPGEMSLGARSSLPELLRGDPRLDRRHVEMVLQVVEAVAREDVVREKGFSAPIANRVQIGFVADFAEGQGQEARIRRGGAVWPHDHLQTGRRPGLEERRTDVHDAHAFL